MSSAGVMMGDYGPRLPSSTDVDPATEVVYQDIDPERILANIRYRPTAGQHLSLDDLDFGERGNGTDADKERRRAAVGNLLVQLSPEQTRHDEQHCHPSISPIDSPDPGSLPTPPGSMESPADTAYVSAILQSTRHSTTEPHTPTTLQKKKLTSRPPQNVTVKREQSARPVPLALTKPGGAYAFAKMEFDDGHYYFNETEVEFGRDVRAMHAAEEKQKRHQEKHSAGSSGRPRSRTSEAQQRIAGSQVAGSVISEKGGICGVDEDLPGGNDELLQRPNTDPSQGSSSSVVNPADLHTRPLSRFDYEGNARANEAFENGDDEVPAQVTTAHLPKKSELPPLIPVHAHARTLEEEIQSHKSISRRHINIKWDNEVSAWMLTVIGRNGAFLDEQFLPYEKSAVLRDGSKIQVKQINMAFRLPLNATVSETEGTETSDQDSPPIARRSRSSTSASSQDQELRIDVREGQSALREKLAAQPASSAGPLGQPMLPKKRGPGRPPKDGISSTRQKKEEERTRREADAKAANGGVTPPPSGRGKPSRPVVTPPVLTTQPKPEKRKYTKRSKADEPIQSIEDEEEVNLETHDTAPPSKKPRRSKSLSPDYPSKESLSAEQLQKPPEPYAHQLYSLLLDFHPKELTLRQVYRAMKIRWPYYIHHTDTSGWQSSVRHNLNNHQGETFIKGKKEGKGFFWSARPGHPPKSESDKKRAAAQDQPPKPPMSRPPQNRPPPGQWHGQPPQNGMPPQFVPPPGQQVYFPPNNPQMIATGQLHVQQNGPTNGQVGQSANFTAVQPQSGQNAVPYQSQQMMPPFAQAAQHNARPPSAPRLSQGSPQQGPATPLPSTDLNEAQQQSLPQKAPPNVRGISNRGPPTCPTTYDGLDTITKFEVSLLGSANDAASMAHTKAILRSARDGALHGKPRPAPPVGISDEDKKRFLQDEIVVYNHIQNFVQNFPNAAFTGFSSISAITRVLDGERERV